MRNEERGGEATSATLSALRKVTEEPHPSSEQVENLLPLPHGDGCRTKSRGGGETW